MAFGDLLANLQPDMSMQMPMAVPDAPADPLIENKGKWQVFMEKMKDPNFKQAALQTGMGMMRSPGIGQNNFDVAGSALQGGLNTLTSLREADRMRGIQEEDRRVAAEQRQNQATQQGVENTNKERQLNQATRTTGPNVELRHPWVVRAKSDAIIHTKAIARKERCKCPGAGGRLLLRRRNDQPAPACEKTQAANGRDRAQPARPG